MFWNIRNPNNIFLSHKNIFWKHQNYILLCGKIVINPAKFLEQIGWFLNAFKHFCTQNNMM